MILTDEYLDAIAESILTKNVRRGAAWLDKEFSGWYDDINIEHLDIMDSSACICGQVFCNSLTDYVHSYEEDVPEYNTGYEYVLAEYFDGDEVECIIRGFQAFTSMNDKNSRWNGDEEVDMRDVLLTSYRNPNKQYHFLAETWVVEILLRRERSSKNV